MNAAALLAELRAAPRGVARLQVLLNLLRGPGGCPWDREQTHASLRPYLLEETYEVLAAIDSGDRDALRAELGDLLLQIVFHTQLAAEAGGFDLDEVAEREVEKMVERHPHVFGDAAAHTAQDVRDQWEQRKRQKEPRRSIADGVPLAMPAAVRAQTISARAASLGFDWFDVGELWPKVLEEVQELQPFVTDAPGAAPEALAEELGDLMFVLVNMARKSGLDAESVLRQATAKFIERFDRMERPAVARHADAAAAALWDAAWERAKHPRG